jgi:hypothetical protein
VSLSHVKPFILLASPVIVHLTPSLFGIEVDHKALALMGVFNGTFKRFGPLIVNVLGGNVNATLRDPL